MMSLNTNDINKLNNAINELYEYGLYNTSNFISDYMEMMLSGNYDELKILSLMYKHHIIDSDKMDNDKQLRNKKHLLGIPNDLDNINRLII